MERVVNVAEKSTSSSNSVFLAVIFSEAIGLFFRAENIHEEYGLEYGGERSTSRRRVVAERIRDGGRSGATVQATETGDPMVINDVQDLPVTLFRKSRRAE
jgi:hypothetical protein